MKTIKINIAAFIILSSFEVFSQEVKSSVDSISENGKQVMQTEKFKHTGDSLLYETLDLNKMYFVNKGLNQRTNSRWEDGVAYTTRIEKAARLKNHRNYFVTGNQKSHYNL